MLTLSGEPFQFDALVDRPDGVWRRPRRFGFVDRVGAVPLSDTELLQTSHHLPLAVREVCGTLEVIAVIHSAFLANPAVRAEGRWLPRYMPIALRCLPFRRSDRDASKAGALEIARDLDAGDDAVALPCIEDGGRLHQDVAAINALLERLDVGRARLARAAASLMAADLLAPLASTNPQEALADDVRLLVVHPGHLQRLTHARTVALASDGPLALDLATAIVFSSRLWKSHLSPHPAGDSDGHRHAGDVFSVDSHSRNAFPFDLRIDDSSLFSFEAFEEGNDQAVDAN